MRIKRLEIQGFKSFKDKTVIHFDHHITGIVGPNGCGKSNIVDAFFWVMGEQSYKHMRGSGSEDLIFNGSSKHVPLGMAEATIVLETDVEVASSRTQSGDQAVGMDMNGSATGAARYELPAHLREKEIAVTRRVFRSGDGEYFINGVPARLKDIQELFMDTGVGTKGYSVIEQGQIGKIVNAKPDERRLLIEEAAGIAKYKARKKESMRKMEAAQANLSRLRDIIIEIERNLSSLERQAQKARLYKKYKDELFEKEIMWGRRKRAAILGKRDSLLKQKESLEQELAGLKAQLQATENAIEVDRVAQLIDTKLLEESQARIQEFSNELTKEQSALDLSHKRKEDLATRLKVLDSEKSNLEKSIAVESEQLAFLERELVEMSAAHDKAITSSSEKETAVSKLRSDLDDARRLLDTCKQDHVKAIEAGSEFSASSASLSSRIEAVEKQLNKLNERSEAALKKLHAVRAESETAHLVWASTKNELSIHEEALKLKSEELCEHEKILEGLESQLNNAFQIHAQLKSRLQSIEELAASYEGFGDGPKAALEWARNNSGDGHLLAVTDFLEVKEGFEKAVSGWLDTRIESLIALNNDIASKTILYISGAKAGLTSVYLPKEVTAVVSGTASSCSEEDICAILRRDGFEVMGTLDKFIGFNADMPQTVIQKAQAAILPAIKNVVVVKSLNQPPLNFFRGWSVVSMDGSAVDCTGPVTVFRGGSRENDVSERLLQRKKIITKLQEEVRLAEAGYKDLETKVATAKSELSAQTKSHHDIIENLHSAELAVLSKERDAQHADKMAASASDELRVLKQEIQKAEDEKADAISSHEKLALNLEQLTFRKQSLQSEISNLETEAGSKETKLR
ncbi:MAG: AAA family ATPase, partial [Bdellovibrionota bacterium]